MHPSKISCIVQGNIRSNTIDVINSSLNLFDFVIFSTWECSELNYFRQYYDGIKNFKIVTSRIGDVVAGLQNRNLQRYTTLQGLKQLPDDFKSGYLVKTRSDLLISNDPSSYFSDLIKLNLNNKIGVLPYRTISMEMDWMSSICDHFMIADYRFLSYLWDYKDFDFTSLYNAPNIEANKFFIEKNYLAESELYWLFKRNLIIHNIIPSSMTHLEIVRNFFLPIDDKLVKFVWFNNQGFVRPIKKSIEHQWWSLSDWKQIHQPTIKYGYNRNLSTLPFFKYLFLNIYNEIVTRIAMTYNLILWQIK